MSLWNASWTSSRAGSTTADVAALLASARRSTAAREVLPGGLVVLGLRALGDRAALHGGRTIVHRLGLLTDLLGALVPLRRVVHGRQNGVEFADRALHLLVLPGGTGVLAVLGVLLAGGVLRRGLVAAASGEANGEREECAKGELHEPRGSGPTTERQAQELLANRPTIALFAGRSRDAARTLQGRVDLCRARKIRLSRACDHSKQHSIGSRDRDAFRAG